MSADWYYMKTTFFYRQKRIGPINEVELLTRIDKGDISPETLLASDSKTHGHWMPMREIRPAYKHWKDSHPNAHDDAA